jgi:hypothetical protein
VQRRYLPLIAVAAVAAAACGGSGSFDYAATVGWVQDGDPIAEVAIGGAVVTSPATVARSYGDLLDAAADTIAIAVTTADGTFALALVPSDCAGHCADAACGDVTAETESWGIDASDADVSGVALRLGSGTCTVDGEPVTFEGR